MRDFSLVVLGNGGMVNHLLPHNGLVISQFFLVDCPPDVVNSFQTVGRSTLDINTVFVSHFHADHTFGFPFFLLNRWITGGYGGPQCTPVTVFGPVGTKGHLTALVELGFQQGHPAREWFYRSVDIQEVSPNENRQLGDWQIEFFRLKHIESSTGFSLVNISGQVMFSYLTDTVWGPEVEQQLARFPQFAWMDMNGGPSGVHASYEDTLNQGLALTGDRTTFLGTHVSQPRTSGHPRIKMVSQGDRF